MLRTRHLFVIDALASGELTANSARMSSLRGRCAHGRRRRVCVECGGSQVCEHEKLRAQCRSCRGVAVCEHGRRRASCTVCLGPQVCPHHRPVRDCSDCGRPQIQKRLKIRCHHRRVAYYCKDCQGAGLCEHGRNRWQCTICSAVTCIHGSKKLDCIPCFGSSICVHHRRRSHCNVCGGTSLCVHGRVASRCGPCNGLDSATVPLTRASSILRLRVRPPECRHERTQYWCQKCGGGGICVHGHARFQCVRCGRRRNRSRQRSLTTSTLHGEGT